MGPVAVVASQLNVQPAVTIEDVVTFTTFEDVAADAAQDDVAGSERLRPAGLR